MLAGIKSLKYYKYSTALLFISVGMIPVFCQSVHLLPSGSLKIKTAMPLDSVKSSKKYSVSGKVTQTYSYCGGAAPSKQILDKLATPEVYTNKRFYIRAGKINSVKARIVKSFTTGNDGTFSIELEPGTYSIILEEQFHKIKAGDYAKQNQHADEQCLQKWWKKPYYIIEIRDRNINNLVFNFHHNCFVSDDIPCLEYTGPPVP